MREWPVVRLGDVCRVQNGFAFDGNCFSESAGTPLIRIRDLKTNQPSLRYDGLFDPQYLVRQGDVLVGMDGEFVAYEWTGPDALLNQRVCRLLPNAQEVDKRFLQLAIGPHLQAIEARTSLTTVKHLSSRSVAEIRLPLPPLDEQRRIAGRLRDQLSVIGDLDQATARRSKELDGLRERVYDAAFPAVPLSTRVEPESPPGWGWRPLRALARLESGHTPSRSRPDWWGGDIPWIALPDIRALDGTRAFDTTEHTNPDGIANSAARILPAGTVVLSRTASVGFVTIMGRPMATSQDFVNWVCGPDLDPDFLMHLFIRSRERFRSFSAGAVHQTVYFPTAEALHVCVPPLEEQRRIAARLREQLDEIDRARAALEAQRAAAAALPAAILREAFDPTLP